MKIAVEADVLARGPKSGIYYYVQRLFSALLELDTTSSYYFVYFGSSRRTASSFGLPPKRAQLRAIVWMPRKLYNALLRIPLAPPIDVLAGLRPDIFIFPAFSRWPLRQTRASVVFVHDTTFIDYPEALKTRHFGWYLRRVVPRSIRYADHVVTLSESSKRSIIANYGTEPDKITVIHPGIDHAVYAPATADRVAAVRRKYGITRDYLLYVGTIEPRKNISGIVAAYCALPADLRQRYQLVLAGSKGWKDADIEALAATVDPDDLVRTGFIEDADMTALYSGAALFLFPSFYEGWGMPVVEAMACGTPVITAANSSLPEAGGEAALYVDAASRDQLRDAIMQVLANPKQREQMIVAGQTHAKAFSWQRSARKLQALLEDLAS
jgi:glycosyltransferase involved in cell wall biosynthesis